MTSTQTTQVITETEQDMDKDLMSKTSPDKGSASCSGNAVSKPVPDEGIGEATHSPGGQSQVGPEEASGPQLSSGDGVYQPELHNDQSTMSRQIQNQQLGRDPSGPDLRGTLSWLMQQSGCTAQQVGKMVAGMLSSQGQASSPESILLQQQLQQLQQQ